MPFHITMMQTLLALIFTVCVTAQSVNMNPPPYVVARQTGSTPVLSLDLSSSTGTATLNPTQVSAGLASLLSMFPVTQQYTTASVTLGISVPSSLQVAIITAVPGSVLVDLMDPAAKSSMASEFEAGNTPAWYSSISPDVKSWFQQFAEDMSTGSPVFTVTSTSTSASTADSDAAEGAAATTSSSRGVAAKPTTVDWSVVANAVAIAGVLGIGIAL